MMWHNIEMKQWSSIKNDKNGEPLRLTNQLLADPEFVKYWTGRARIRTFKGSHAHGNNWRWVEFEMKPNYPHNSNKVKTVKKKLDFDVHKANKYRGRYITQSNVRATNNSGLVIFFSYKQLIQMDGTLMSRIEAADYNVKEIARMSDFHAMHDMFSLYQGEGKFYLPDYERNITWELEEKQVLTMIKTWLEAEMDRKLSGIIIDDMIGLADGLLDFDCDEEEER